MGKHTLLRLDNYTGLGQGLVALKTNAHIHTENIVRALSSRQPQILLHSSDYSEPQWSHLLWNTQPCQVSAEPRHNSNMFDTALARSFYTHIQTWWSFMFLTARGYLERSCNMLTENIERHGRPRVPGFPLMNCKEKVIKNTEVLVGTWKHNITG